MTTIVAYMNLDAPTMTVTLPAIEDSGSLIMAQAGRSQTCGKMSYNSLSGLDWISQSPENDREFHLSLNDDATLIGDHELSVSVTSDDYSAFIAAKTVDFKVRIICRTIKLEPLFGPSARAASDLHVVYASDGPYTVSLPKFVP